VFGDGLRGVRATEDIEPNEAFLFIPNKLMLSVEHAKASELDVIFKSHDALFRANYERDSMIMVLYLMYEKLKGENSFYHPYFDSVALDPQSCLWDDQYVSKLVDLELKS